MRYFVRIRDNPDAANYGETLAAYRFDGEAGVAERWTGDGWEFNPEVIDAFGLGGTTDFREVPAEEADAFINRGGPGSGHFGHEGRQGEVGGSQPSGGRTGISPSLLKTDAIAPYLPTVRDSIINGMKDRAGHVEDVIPPGETRSTLGYGDYWILPDGTVIQVSSHDRSANAALDIAQDRGDIPTEFREFFGAKGDEYIPAGKMSYEGLMLGLGLVRWSTSGQQGVSTGGAKMTDEQAGRISEMAGRIPRLLEVLPWEAWEPQVSGETTKYMDLNHGPEGRGVESLLRVRGGPGSGNFGHEGRPGQVGGSAPGGGPEKAWLTDSKGHILEVSNTQDISLFNPNLPAEWQANVTIDWPKHIGENLVDIHTHPTATWPSDADWAQLSMGHANEVRVVLPNSEVISIVRPEGKFPTPRELRERYQAIENDIFDSGRSQNLSVDKIIQEINRRMAEETGARLTVGQFSDFHGQDWAEEARAFIGRGGPGSGHFGHAGRPGEVGGSAPGGGPQFGRLGENWKAGTSEAVAGDLSKWSDIVASGWESAFGRPTEVERVTNDAEAFMQQALSRGGGQPDRGYSAEQAASMEKTAIGAYDKSTHTIWLQDERNGESIIGTGRWIAGAFHEMGHALIEELPWYKLEAFQVPELRQGVLERFGYPTSTFREEYAADLLSAHAMVATNQNIGHTIWRTTAEVSGAFQPADYKNLNRILALINEPRVAIRAKASSDYVVVIYPAAGEAISTPRSDVPEARPEDLVVIRYPPTEEPEDGAFVDSPSPRDLRAGVLRRWLDRRISKPLTERGGPGSGHFGHAGRPGERGGSAPSGGVKEPTTAGRPYPKLATADLAFHDAAKEGPEERASLLSELRHAIEGSGSGSGSLSGQGGHIANMAYSKAVRQIKGETFAEQMQQAQEEWTERWHERYMSELQTEVQNFIDEKAPPGLSDDDLRQRLGFEEEKWITLGQQEIRDELLSQFASQYLNENYDIAADLVYDETSFLDVLEDVADANQPEPPAEELSQQVHEEAETAPGSLPEGEHYLAAYDGESFIGIAQTTEAPAGSREHDREVNGRLNGTPYESYTEDDFMVLHFLAAAKSGEAYGTKIMREVFRQAAQHDMGVIGSSVEEAVDFYGKLGTRYTGGERATEGVDMLWTPEGVKETLALMEQAQLPEEEAPAPSAFSGSGGKNAVAPVPGISDTKVVPAR